MSAKTFDYKETRLHKQGNLINEYGCALYNGNVTIKELALLAHKMDHDLHITVQARNITIDAQYTEARDDG